MAHVNPDRGARARKRRRVVGAGREARVTTAAQRTVKASRRAYFRLYAPRVVLNPWRNEAEWRAGQPKLLALGLVVLLALALFQLFNADFFFVGDLQLSGSRLLTRTEVDRAAGVRGWNIFFVNPREVEANLEKLPEVKGVRVQVNVPNQVSVQINERQPRFIWQTGAETYWVDDDGIALRVRGNWQQGLVLRDLNNTPVKLGERVKAEAFNAAVSLRNAWQKGPRVFEWSAAHGLAIRDEHGWLIYFGNASQMPEKVAALKIVTEQIVREKKSVTFIDLGNGLPYYQEAARVVSGK